MRLGIRLCLDSWCDATRNINAQLSLPVTDQIEVLASGKVPVCIVRLDKSPDHAHSPK
jgi:hypothetical protein